MNFTYRIWRKIVAWLLTLGVLVGILLASQIFTIDTIRVIGDGIALQINEKEFPNNLLFFPEKKVTDALLYQYPLVEAISFHKIYPHTLEIEIVLHTPIAVLRTGKQAVYLSHDGTVLGDVGGSFGSLPEIIMESRIVFIGMKIQDKQILTALNVISFLHKSIPISKVYPEDKQSIRVMIEKMNILFPQDDAIAERVSTLQTLIAGFRIKGTIPTRIDLRFTKPIVTF